MINSDNYRTDFSNSKIKNLDIRNSRMAEVIFDYTTISSSDFSGNYPINSDFSKTNFSEDNVINACLNSTISDKIINKILRGIRENLQNNIITIEDILVNFCS
jgi:uncharacterized protein YjbI with pentapeptide repeats